MARHQGALRTAINDWIENNPIAELLSAWFAGAQDRGEEINQLLDGAATSLGFLVLPYLPLWVFGGMLYAVTGIDVFIGTLRTVGDLASFEDAVSRYREFWREAYRDDERNVALEAVGALISEPLLSAVDAIARSPDEPPEQYLRRIYGVLASLTLAPGVAASALEAASIGQLETPARVLDTLGRVLDLGFIGSATAAPLIEAGIVDNMRRSLRARYRPKRFSASELRDLFALGEISEGRLNSEARELGWREPDIGLWKRLAFRVLNESDIWSLYKAGEISRDEVAIRLRAKGYDPADIPLLFKVNTQDEALDAETVTRSTARRSYREGLIGEAEFRALLESLELAEREIDLLVAIEDLGRQTELRALTVSQIKAAWEENVLSDPEVRHYLQEEGFGPAEIDILLATWQLENEPRFRKLNKGTILGAYVAGVIDRAGARLKLVEVGLRPEDAALELDLVEIRNPEAFGQAEPPPPRSLSPGTLGELLEAGLIQPGEMQARLTDQGYTAEDADLLTQAAVMRAEEEARPLSQSLVERAYVSGVIDRQRAAMELRELDFADDVVEQILTTVEAEHPAVFAPDTVRALRLPSVGALAEALRSEIIDEGTYFARMAELGYERDSAELYLQLSLRQERKKTRALTRSQIERAYDEGIFSWGEAMLELTQQGYSDRDARITLDLVNKPIEDTEVWKLLRAGRVPAESAFQQLFSMGYTEEEINEAIAGLEA